jgi:2,3-bisphosphoglycerate-dependent phosphoglycerate mutase
MTKLTLLRHGESIWNREKRFTGWTDVGLSVRGVAQAERAGRLLKARGCTFDVCFTSYLNRAIETLRIVLETMGLRQIPVRKSWCLNERHYGALQGLSWWEAVWKYGLKQVLIWQRHFDVRPPALDAGDARFPGYDPRYAALAQTQLPYTESLQDTLARILPYWYSAIVPEIRQGKHILIVAHGNSLRGLLKYLDNVADRDIAKVTVPVGQPLVYELDNNVRPLRHFYMRRPAKLAQWAQAQLGQWVEKAFEKGQQ